MPSSTSDLTAAIDRLISTCRQVPTDSAFSFAPAPRVALEPVLQRLPLTPELLHWYESGAPETFRFDWGSEFQLYDPRTLRDALLGYRWDERESELDGGEWRPHWVMIGDWGSDPVIAHVDEPGTPVSMAIHGIGVWQPKRIAPDLGSFLNGMAVWLEVFFIRWKGEYQDEDCVVLPEILDEFNREIRSVLPEEYAAYWPWGTAY